MDDENVYDDENTYDENTYDDLESVVESVSTKNTNKNTRRKWMEDVKNLDPGYTYVTRIVKKPITPGLKVEVLCKDSNDTDVYYTGTIICINSKNTYDIQLETGYKRIDVSKSNICFPNSVMKGVRTKIPFYFNSLNPNITIRNAVNGVYEKAHKTGTSDEDLFFKVTLATGEKGNKDPYILFFSDPEQYERHFYCTVPAETKTYWVKKSMIAREKFVKQTTTRLRNIEIR